jgi:hypothetical protein
MNSSDKIRPLTTGTGKLLFNLSGWIRVASHLSVKYLTCLDFIVWTDKLPLSTGGFADSAVGNL